MKNNPRVNQKETAANCTPHPAHEHEYRLERSEIQHQKKKQTKQQGHTTDRRKYEHSTITIHHNKYHRADTAEIGQNEYDVIPLIVQVISISQTLHPFTHHTRDAPS